MTQAVSLAFQNLVLLVGDGAAQESFTPVGALTSRKHGIKNKTASTDVPDANDDSLPMSTELETQAVTHQITFDGVTNMGAQFTLLRQWAEQGLIKNVQIKYNAPLAEGGGYYQGAALLSDFTPGSAKKGEKSTISGTIDSSGLWVWTPAAA